LTRLERVDAKGKLTLITDDTLAMNWANSGGADREFYPGFEHYADLLTYTEGAKSFSPMTLRHPAYWAWELKTPGIYRMHLLLTGPMIEPLKAVFEMTWPVKKLENAQWSLSECA
jgi:hypothetical protein